MDRHEKKITASNMRLNQAEQIGFHFGNIRKFGLGYSMAEVN